MFGAHHKSTKSMQLSNLPTRGPSRSKNSIDSNIEMLLNSPKFVHNRQKSDVAFENALLDRHSKTQSKLANYRQIQKAQELQELREAPSLFSGAFKKFQRKSQQEIQKVVESIPKNVKAHEKKQKKIDERRPQDVIPMPEVDVIKEVLSRIVPVEKKEEVHLKEMNIVEKGNYFKNLKENKIKDAATKKKQEEMQQCTFKPDLKKPELKVEKKPVKKNSKSSKNLVKSKGKAELEKIRPPAPVISIKGNRTKSVDYTNILLTENYFQFSPVIGTYHFKEGADIERFMKRSKEMVTYNAFTTRPEE